MARYVLLSSAMQDYMLEIQSLQPLKKNPLENLMLQQLQQLISGENILQKRYARLSASADSDDEIAQFEAEMIQLESRADRLYRMINAMSEGAFV